VERFQTYASTHGARDDREYIEGSLARIVEASAGGVPTLPSVKAVPELLCGLEFDTLQAEHDFLARHGLHVEAVEVALAPGQLLVFDNLAVAHGRAAAGSRASCASGCSDTVGCRRMPRRWSAIACYGALRANREGLLTSSADDGISALRRRAASSRGNPSSAGV
jgi:hypothetical protein